MLENIRKYCSLTYLFEASYSGRKEYCDRMRIYNNNLNHHSPCQVLFVLNGPLCFLSVRVDTGKPVYKDVLPPIPGAVG